MGSVNGNAPSAQCGESGTNGTLTFPDSPTQLHIQRSALAFLNGVVYIAFTPDDRYELANGWLFGYSFTGSSFSPVATPLVTTPYGTGGGIWQSGNGPVIANASVGNQINPYLFLSTGNGTFDVATPRNDFGSSVLRIDPNALTISDHFTPADTLTYNGLYGSGGRCSNDVDLGSGGLMAFPDSFFTNHARLLVTADKESKLYVIDADTLTGYNPSGDTIVQEVVTPPPPTQLEQGYWSNPAYWEWGSGGNTQRALYYSPEINHPTQTTAPLPLDVYVLANSAPGPIPVNGTSGFGLPSEVTTTLFCNHGTTPSISANASASGTGILWAIEDSNAGNNQGIGANCSGSPAGAALHAYNATYSSSNNGVLPELYSSSGLNGVQGGIPIYRPTKFQPPTIFKSRVYFGTMGQPSDGTNGQVLVFGLCGTPSRCIQ